MPPYLELSVASIVAVYLLETYIDVRQHRKTHETQRPREIVDIIDEEKFLKSRAYQLDKANFGFVASFVNGAKSLATLLLGVFPVIWAFAGSVLEYLGITPDENEIAHSLMFMLIYWCIELVLDLPFSLYSTFVIEQKHGFNKQTPGLFVTDFIKTFVLTVVIGGPVLAGALFLIRWGGEHFYLYVWAFMTAFQFNMLAIYPTLIQPLFNKVDPLPDSSLKTKIEALAAKLAFPLKKLHVIDGSRRSGHSNAYYYGFFKNKRIVLYDTLINQMSEEEVVAVLAHELGHWKLNHVIQNIIISEVNLFVIFWLFGLFLNDTALYESFGFHGTKPAMIGLILFSLIYSPVGHVLGFALNFLSRTFEFQADAFAKKLGYASELRSGLIKLQLENLSNMNPDPWYSTYHYSHPPLVERLKAIQKSD